MSRRVVITGMGIWSCIGQDLETVTESFRTGRSGIVFEPERLEFGLQSGLVGNVPRPDLKPLLPRKYRATMSEDAEYAYMAARQAFTQAGITDEYLREHEVGCIFGNDGNTQMLESCRIMEQDHDSTLIDPNSLFRGETSSVTMNLTTAFGLRGASMVIGGACSSGSHAIGIAMMYILSGSQHTMLVGGSCQVVKEGSVGADALDALSHLSSDPQHASRPFDRDRDGMVPSGGAAALVLEEYEHAKARGAKILAEVAGYGFSSNGTGEIYEPSAEGEYIAMRRALDDAGVRPEEVDYVNAHATSTIAGDIAEAEALKRLFGVYEPILAHKKQPWISSTKSMTGHENWMAGASEAVYSVLMMQNNFIAPSINIENLMPEAEGLRIARETQYQPVNIVLSNSSGMGGTNSALVFMKVE